MSNARVVFFSFAWLFSVFVIIGLMAFGGVLAEPQGVDMPYGLGSDDNNGNTAEDPPQDFGTQYSQCHSQLGWANWVSLGLGCTLNTVKEVFRGNVYVPIISDIFGLVNSVIKAVVFLWDMSRYSIAELPAAVNLLLFAPPGAALITVAISIVRGVG